MRAPTNGDANVGLPYMTRRLHDAMTGRYARTDICVTQMSVRGRRPDIDCVTQTSGQVGRIDIYVTTMSGHVGRTDMNDAKCRVEVRDPTF